VYDIANSARLVRSLALDGEKRNAGCRTVSGMAFPLGWLEQSDKGAAFYTSYQWDFALVFGMAGV
jgi:hypothetical protein